MMTDVGSQIYSDEIVGKSVRDYPPTATAAQRMSLNSETPLWPSWD